MQFFVFGVVVSSHCWPLSNVDFVHFVWQNFERISSKQYVITLIPFNITFTSVPPRLLCFKYYRVARGRWMDAANCDTCVEQYQVTVRRQAGCRLPETCHCTICLQQPPSLFDSALHVCHKMVYNLDGFKLTLDTTCQPYVYTSEANRVDPNNILPPEFLAVQIWFRYQHPTTERKFHRDCSGVGTWEGELSLSFLTADIAIHDLVLSLR